MNILYVPPIKQAAQYSTKGHPAVIATRAERTPLAISLAFIDSDWERIYKRIIDITLYHDLTCAHDAMITANVPPEAPAIIILTAIIDGTAWNGMGAGGLATQYTKVVGPWIVCTYTVRFQLIHNWKQTLKINSLKWNITEDGSTHQQNHNINTPKAASLVVSFPPSTGYIHSQNELQIYTHNK